MIKLDKFLYEDFDRLINWISDERFMYQFSGPVFKFPLNHRQLENYITSLNRKVYRVRHLPDNVIIGHAEINNINYEHKTARLARILIGDENYRSKGLGELLIKLLLKIGFNELKLHRIDLGVFDFNKSAIKCYEKCGFKKEGLLRESFKFKDEYWSVYNMSILKHEWKGD